MQITIREIDKSSPRELRVVTERCMLTVLETIPDFEGREDLARRSLPNFSFDAMSRMIENDFGDPSKRIVVAASEGTLVGQALYSIKLDADGRTYGSCFSRYVLPEYRQMGIASALMEDAIRWFTSKGASYICAQTHVGNTKLQGLFRKFGFTTEGPFAAAWEYVLLRKELSSR